MSPQFEVSVLNGNDGLSRLEAEWRALYDCAISPSPPQGFEFCNALQAVLPTTASAHLLVATCRTTQGLVGLWPVLVEQKRGFVWLESAGFGAGEEYAGPLIADSADAPAVADALMRGLGAHGDVIKTTVPLDNPVCPAASCLTWAAACPKIAFSAAALSERRTLSASFGWKIGQNFWYYQAGSVMENKGAAWWFLLELLHYFYKAAPHGKFIMGYVDFDMHDEERSGGLLRSRRACRVTAFPTSVLEFDYAHPD